MYIKKGKYFHHSSSQTEKIYSSENIQDDYSLIKRLTSTDKAIQYDYNHEINPFSVNINQRQIKYSHPKSFKQIPPSETIKF